MVTPLAHIRCGQEDTVAAESADEDAAPALADAGRTGLPAAAPSASVAAAHESFRDRIRCVIRHPCHRAAWARVFSCPHGARSSLPSGTLVGHLAGQWRRTVRSGSCAPDAGWVGVVRGPWGAVLQCRCRCRRQPASQARRQRPNKTTRFLTKLPRCGSCQRVPALLVLCCAVPYDCLMATKLCTETLNVKTDNHCIQVAVRVVRLNYTY